MGEYGKDCSILCPNIRHGSIVEDKCLVLLRQMYRYGEN